MPKKAQGKMATPTSGSISSLAVTTDSAPDGIVAVARGIPSGTSSESSGVVPVPRLPALPPVQEVMPGPGPASSKPPPPKVLGDPTRALVPVAGAPDDAHRIRSSSPSIKRRLNDDGLAPVYAPSERDEIIRLRALLNDRDARLSQYELNASDADTG